MSKLTWEQLDACHSADAIADLLRAAGITGRRGDYNTCPLACATRWCVYANVRTLSPSPSSRGISLTRAEIVFVKRFDRGKYLDLIEEEPEP